MTLGVSLAIGLLLLLSSGALVWNARRIAADNADNLLIVGARRVEREANRDADHIDVAEMMADQRDFASENLAMMIVDREGHILQRSQNLLPKWPRNRWGKERDGWRVRTVRVGDNTAVIGYYWRPVQMALRAQALELLSLSLIVMLAGTVGAWFLVGYTLSPIARLSTQAQSASIDGLEVQLSPPSQDEEMLQLVHTLNGLLSRLAQTANARQRFYAAASHELRTPLQALTGHLGLALRRQREAQEYEQVIREAQEQTRRLNALVNDLLLLNQLETAQLPVAESVDLAALCRATLASYAPLAEQRALTVRTDLPTDLSEKAFLKFPSTHASILVRNLVENALKYCQAGGVVSVRIDRDEHRLEIVNDYDSEFAWEAERLFEPFYRPDSSRTSATGGNGLGLAICKALADANGWQLALNKVEHQIHCSVRFVC